MAFQKGNKFGNRFTSTNQPKVNGRKPYLYTQLKDVYEISQMEYRKVVMFLMNATKEEIEKLSKNPDTPVWVVNICTAFLNDVKRGTTYLLSELTDRLFGKPRQVNENYNENNDKNKAIVIFTKDSKESEE